MTNFTPGPWNVLLDEFIVPKAPIGETVPVIAKMDGPINAELRANARLIALSPDMADFIEIIAGATPENAYLLMPFYITRAKDILAQIAGQGETP